MKLVAVEIKNFRSYKERTRIEFDNITAFIGKNDVGKSTILESLEIFFNNDVVKIDSDDLNKEAECKEIIITCEFSDLPQVITIDSGAKTSLEDEYLLSENKNLRIEKVFDCSKNKVSEKVFVVCEHPSAKGYDNLLSFKEDSLKRKMKELGLKGSLKGNPNMRHEIWNHAISPLNIKTRHLDLGKGAEDGKRIWDKLNGYLPMFALFQSDRASKDSDDEVQNPLKGAIDAAIAEASEHINEIGELVEKKANEIAELTHAALKEIDPKLADSLKPKYNKPQNSKWARLFSLGMETNNGIPLNKRGSGARRMILVSFFKAEAERRLKTSTKSNIIYAIEEPETSQHPDNQRVLIEALKKLSMTDGCQVVTTTHSPGLAVDIPEKNIRFIQTPYEGATPKIKSGVDVFGDVGSVLGLIPDSRVKALIYVEGNTDLEALKKLSKILHEKNTQLPDLSTDGRFAFVISGGSSLKHWVNNNYLDKLGLPEAHIYDSDKGAESEDQSCEEHKYQKYIDIVNNREDGSWGKLTNKREIENYLHPDAIKDEFGFDCDFDDRSNVEEVFIKEYNKKEPGAVSKKKAKRELNKAFGSMTYERLEQRNAIDEVTGWMRKLARMVE